MGKIFGIVVVDEAKEEFQKKVKTWPSPQCDIPVLSLSEWAAMEEGKE